MSKQRDVVTQPSPLPGSRFCFIAWKPISPFESIWPRTDRKKSCLFGSELQTKGSLCQELTMTNKEEPVDLGEKWRIMKRSHGEKKTLAVCLDVCLSCH